MKILLILISVYSGIAFADHVGKGSNKQKNGLAKQQAEVAQWEKIAKTVTGALKSHADLAGLKKVLGQMEKEVAKAGLKRTGNKAKDFKATMKAFLKAAKKKDKNAMWNPFTELFGSQTDQIEFKANGKLYHLYVNKNNLHVDINEIIRENDDTAPRAKESLVDLSKVFPKGTTLPDGMDFTKGTGKFVLSLTSKKLNEGDYELMVRAMHIDRKTPERNRYRYFPPSVAPAEALRHYLRERYYFTDEASYNYHSRLLDQAQQRLSRVRNDMRVPRR